MSGQGQAGAAPEPDAARVRFKSASMVLGSGGDGPGAAGGGGTDDVRFEELVLESKGSGRRYRVGCIRMASARSPINVFDEPLGLALDAAIAEAERWCRETAAASLPPFAVVICSGHEGAFMAGADIKLQAELARKDRATAVSVQIREVLLRLEALPIPTVAVLNGTTLGGGLELALACSYRICQQDVKVLGLPEAKLGLIPGAGGCVRLPRLIGLYQALPLIVSGKLIKARKALRLGLVDRLCAHADYTDTSQFPGWEDELLACWDAGHLATPLQPHAKYGRVYLGRTWAEQRLLQWYTARQLDQKTGGRFPAPYVVLDTVLRCWQAPLEAAFLIEARAYVSLVLSTEAKNFMGLFLASRAAKRRATRFGLPGADGDGEDGDGSAPPEEPLPDLATTVLGAGHMGGGIAQGLLYRGLPVRLHDVSPEVLEAAKARILKLFGYSVRGGHLSAAEVQERMDGLALTTSPTLPALGPGQVAFVLETIPEQLALKQEALARLAADAAASGVDPSRVVFATNTSSIELEHIAEGSPALASRVVGMHYFNPERNLTPVIEIVRGASTDPQAVRLVAQLTAKLGKTPIVVKSSPGFVANRIAAAWYKVAAAIVVGGGASFTCCDAAMEKIGFPLGPFRALDFIGLKTAKLVASSLAGALAPKGDDNEVGALVDLMLERGFLGRTSGDGTGFYHWNKGRKGAPNEAIMPLAMVARSQLAAQRSRDESLGLQTPRMKSLGGGLDVCNALLFALINASCEVLSQGVAHSAAELDLMLVMSIGFPPQHGGPLAMADAYGLAALCEDMGRLFATTRLKELAPHPFLQEMVVAGDQFYPGRPNFGPAKGVTAPYRRPVPFDWRSGVVLGLLTVSVALWFAPRL